MSPKRRTDKALSKPWQARIRRNYEEFSLGYYATREEAAAVELNAAANWPSNRGTNGYGLPRERRKT